MMHGEDSIESGLTSPVRLDMIIGHINSGKTLLTRLTCVTGGGTSGVMSVNEQREEIQRVLRSAQFRRAPKLQRFLSLICEYHFTNRSHDINEYIIAMEAFGKGADFDASQDSLVRVQAREARRRLHEYYQDEGKGSKLILEIPLGSYAPVFSAPFTPPRLSV
jgi:hypothetical protein